MIRRPGSPQSDIYAKDKERGIVRCSSLMRPLALISDAFGHECAVRLVKDNFIDGRITTKLH
jgi:hypothetical protein